MNRRYHSQYVPGWKHSAETCAKLSQYARVQIFERDNEGRFKGLE